MANSDKNIKITPNISASGQPNIVYTGSGNVPIALKVLDDSYGTLSFEGSAGQLFSLNNNLSSGTIFSVNDISGMPQFDVNADGTIRVAPYGSGVYMGGVGGGTFTIQPSAKSSSGAGTSVAITAGNGVTSGAGGSLILQAGIQATTGGDGKVVVKQASGQTSNLQEWQDSSGTATAYVQANGNVRGRGFFDIGGNYGIDLSTTGSAYIGLRANTSGGYTVCLTSSSITLPTNALFGFSPSGPATTTADVSIYRDAAGVLAQRNGTNAQTFRVYNTYTDASNYERLGITWASNICTIGVAQAGTGVPRVLNVNANNINAPTLPASATVTAATGNGTTVTYTCANTFSVGQIVSITGLTITTGSSLNLSNQTITTASATQFTVTNATVGTAAATQSGTATIQSAGNSVTITAGNGSGVGAGGNIILQPGAQGTSGGNGLVRFYSSAGVATGYWDPNTSTLNGGDTLYITSKLRVRSGAYINGSYGLFDFATANNASTVVVTLHDSNGFRMNRTGIYGFSNDVYGTNWTSAALDAGIGRADFGVTCVVRDTSKNGGSLSFPSTTTAFSANTNDLVLTASAFQRINCTSAASLTGIAPPSGGTHVDGRMVRVYNVGTANLTLAHNSASSAAANRMFNSTGADIVLGPNDYAELIYDATSNGSGAAGWRVS